MDSLNLLLKQVSAGKVMVEMLDIVIVFTIAVLSVNAAYKNYLWKKKFLMFYYIGLTLAVIALGLLAFLYIMKK